VKTPALDLPSSGGDSSSAGESETPLHALIARASEADQDVVTCAKNRVLIRDMAVALVAQARLIADYQLAAEDRRIILPGSE